MEHNMPHIKSFQGTDCSKSKRGPICDINRLREILRAIFLISSTKYDFFLSIFHIGNKIINFEKFGILSPF